MKIAVVGAGISGLVCAWLLSPLHEVALFEQDPRAGGHTNTLAISHEGRSFPVDTGFIVFNERNYPSFCTLLRRLNVSARDTTMSFSVRDAASGFEYGGQSAAGAIGPWSNLLRPRWWRVARGVASLGRTGPSILSNLNPNATIADLYTCGAFSRGFLDDYLIPMAAAIWSAPRDRLLEFPARFMLRFFDHHGMLNLRERPQWRSVVGGSRAYIDAMMPRLGPLLRTGCPVDRITRRSDGVMVTAAGRTELFDAAILAAHADQSLAMLADANPLEREVLSALPFQANETVLHTDASFLPRLRRCWAAWNYRLDPDPAAPIAVTYNMSILQGFETREPLCVTLNHTAAINPSKVLARFTYHHPIYTRAGETARTRWDRISGPLRTHFCGAYWGNGFHEDGVASALRVCGQFGVTL